MLQCKVVVVRCVGVDASCSSIIPPAPEGGGRSLMLRQVWVGRCVLEHSALKHIPGAEKWCGKTQQRNIGEADTALSRNEDWWKTVSKRKGTSVAPVLS